MKKWIFLILVIGLGGCDKPEAPQFKYLENVIVEIESLSVANLRAEAVLFNPNKNTITIKNADIDIIMEDKTIAVLDRQFDIKAQGNSDFIVPLDIKIQLKDLNLNAIGAAFGLFGGKGPEVRYLGKIKVKAYGMPISVKVDYRQNINIKI